MASLSLCQLIRFFLLSVPLGHARLHENAQDRRELKQPGISSPGQNGFPRDAYPLSECEGDCDNDEDCAGEMICFEHAPGDAVPGCSGGEDNDSNTDYCIQDVPKTAAPTASHAPSPFPSASLAPTEAITSWGPFQLKLHWTTRSCWQDICKKEVTKWCMQCEGHRCNKGDILWVEPCRRDRPYQQQFTWTKVHVGKRETWGQLQVQDSSDDDWLCLQRIPAGGRTNQKLEPCDASNHHQWYAGAGFQSNSPDPFEIYPHSHAAAKNNTDEESEKCVTMPHHPRHFEEIYFTDCKSARSSRTALWETIWPSSTQEDGVAVSRSFDRFDKRQYYRIGGPRRNPSCSEERTCGICEGHCRSDDECNGSLKCFERSRRNAWQSPPGCYGSGVPEMDYCYAERGN